MRRLTHSINSADTSDLGNDGYFHPAGFIRYHKSGGDVYPSGLYWMGGVADQSWSWQGAITNAVPTAYQDKFYPTPQASSWWTATEIRSDQPVFVFWHFAVEDWNESEWSTLIFQATTRCESEITSGNPSLEVYHIIIVPTWHDISGLTSQEIIDTFEAFQAAAYSLSTGNIATASLYEATDKTQFIGSGANTWLANNEWIDGTSFNGIDFTDSGGYNGDLLDSNELHYVDQDSARLFANILGSMIDQANGSGNNRTYWKIYED
jgi:hypothetical protein